MLAPTAHHPAVRDPERGSAPGENGARLVRVGTGETFAIRDGTAMIGRDRDSDLVVAGPAVSRRHSIVRRLMRGYIVTDVSRNGTYVNGRRVRGARLLRTGDMLRIGDEEFRFEVSATLCTGVALPALCIQRLAQLRSAVPLEQIARRIAAVLRPRVELILSRARSASRLGRVALRRRLRHWRMRGSRRSALARVRGAPDMKSHSPA